MKLLIDADYIVYKSCASAETEIDFGEDLIVVTSNFNDVMKTINRELDKIKKEFFDSTLILFFSHHENFRKKLYPDYKGHRNRKKPCGYKRAINALSLEHEVIIMETLEADDALGIYATANPGNVIVSPDKDMRQIPGKLYDLNEVTEIDPEEGRRWHLVQSLAGDQTDGYSGVPGIGVKRAIALFEQDGYTWKTVIEAFKDKGLGEDVALMNARLAKILTCNDYDLAEQRPILWTPTDAGYGDDDGTGVQLSEDS